MPISGPEKPQPVLVTAAGSIATESALVAEVDRLLDELGSSVLEQPIWMVVPSISLRAHILSTIVRHRGRGIAGLACWTLHGLASEIVQRSGEPERIGINLVPILIRRFVADERSLREGLEHLADGYQTVVGSVQDLLDAGLAEAHHDALEEVLAQEGPRVSSRAAVARARSIVRVATRVSAEIEKLELGHNSTVLEQATDLVRFDSPIEPGIGGLLIHGFSDATGLASDFIVALLEKFSGHIFLDLPPDIGDLSRDDPGVEFARRFRERIEAVATSIRLDTDRRGKGPKIRLVRSYGAQAEAREVATRIRTLLDKGSEPEAIGLVARQLEPYVSPLRTHFYRLGIPFSGIGAKGPQLPIGRKIQGFVELLKNRQACSVDRWIDIRDCSTDRVPDFDLRLGLFGLAQTTIEEVAKLDLKPFEGRTSIPLPVGVGFDIDDDSDGQTRLQHRTIPLANIDRLRLEAEAICSTFSSWPTQQPWPAHQARLYQLAELLGWTQDTEISSRVSEAWSQLGSEIPEGLELQLEEVVTLLIELLRSIGFSDLGGSGSGVQILDVIEARGRTFDHLFVVGLNQGLFPRAVREDPLLDDSLRQVIGREGHGVLPDLARKLTGHSEERYLFAQLLWSSPEITLSWQFADDDGKTAIPSPLLQRLRLSRYVHREEELVPCLARHPFSGVPRETTDAYPEVFTPYERAVRTALWGARKDLSTALRGALDSLQLEGSKGAGHDPEDLEHPIDSSLAVAVVRTKILDEVDPLQGQRLPPGPYLGYIGSARLSGDPRTGQPLYITTLESMARCPWQTFLKRFLRLESLPDPSEVLPAIDARLVGQLVHRSLEKIVGDQLIDSTSRFEDLRGRSASPIEWPQPRRLENLLLREAHRLVFDMGLNWKGMAEILTEISRPYIQQAIELDRFEDSPGAAIAVEVEGQLQVAETTIHFRADRVDRRGDDLSVFDYKTGSKPIITAKRESVRRKNLLTAIRDGRHLQAAAYSNALGSPNDTGEYLFLHPELNSDTRRVEIRGDDSQARDAFRAATGSLVESWHQGVFFPRLVEPGTDKEPTPCSYCEVAEACARGDSGVRGRLTSWASDPSDDSLMFRRSWFLGDRESEESP
jgi:hypothetical protein